MEDDWEKFKIVTAYNRIELRRYDNRLELLSGNRALQSVVDLDHPARLQLKTLEYLAAILLFIPPPRRILLLGTAAGSVLHFLRRHYPTAEIIALDIDAELIEQLLALHILPPAGNGLTYVYDDAAHFIAKANAQFDLILCDIFVGAHSPPWLIEKKCLTQLRRLLTVEGALAHNLIISSETRFKHFYRDLRLVFDQRSLCLSIQEFENILTYAFRYPVPIRSMDWYRQRALELGASHEIDYLQIIAAIYNTNPIGAGIL